MDLQKIRGKFEELNPSLKYPKLFKRMDGRVEYICSHGVGHTIYSEQNDWTHGCDGCCKDIKVIEEKI